jgi:hypothetical protein
VLDDGWQPWDLLLYHGIWLRGRVKILVGNHGAEKRQIDVGMQLRRTIQAKLVTSVCAIGAVLSAALGTWWAAGPFAGALLATEAFLGHRVYRFAQTFRAVVAASFRSLPVVALGGGDAEPARR